MIYIDEAGIKVWCVDNSTARSLKLKVGKNYIDNVTSKKWRCTQDSPYVLKEVK